MALPEVNRFLIPPRRITEGIDRAWLDETTASKTQITWGIHRNGQHIGFTRVYLIDWSNRRAYGSTWLGELSFQGQGLATEATRLRNEFVFTETAIEKMMAEVLVENLVSQRWVERLGYRHYGIARHHILRDSDWHDVWLAELLKRDWQALQGKS
jgi:RimJ/RimL family protein N-acetyltransferase